MSDLQLVSVVIPSYNHERYIEQAIESVFQQSYRPIELIIVDDCSRDRSPEIIASLKERYRKLDPKFRFIFIRNAKNSDAPTTINLGLSKAKGRFITVLNSDDYYAPDRVKTLVEVANKKNKELLFSDVEIVDEAGITLPGQHPKVHWLHQALSFRHEMPSVGFTLLRRPYVVTSGNLFFSRTLLKRLKGFRHFRWHHDWDFVLRATRFTEPFFISKKLISYRIHGSNTISEMEANSKEIGRQGSARSECEIRRIIEDFYEDAMIEPVSDIKGHNPLAPVPEFWPRYFLNFLKYCNIWYSQQQYLSELSFCNRSLLQKKDAAIDFFKNAGMSKEDIILSLRVFPEITYMHVESFPWKVQKRYPSLRVIRKTTVESKDHGYLGTLLSLSGTFRGVAPMLQETFVAIFRGERLAGVARAISTQKSTIRYLGFLSEPLAEGEIPKLKLYLIEPNQYLDYTLCLPKAPRKPKKKEWKHGDGRHYGHVDHVQQSGSHLIVGGWSAHNGELPVSIKAFFNGTPIGILPSLYFRPDLSGLLEHPNKTSIAGFRFWLNLGFYRIFSQNPGVLEIRSEFKDSFGTLSSFKVSCTHKGFLVKRHEPTRRRRKR